MDESVDAKTLNMTHPDDRSEQNTLVAQLQSEVHQLREQLQVTIEEFDSSNEEMKAANEELQSINEEYRSATEELETSKEELQSVNEELQTVNNDMKNKLEEISRAHQELENIMGASEIGTLFLDREFRIQRFTAGVSDVINIMPTDRGRPIGHLTHRLKYEGFMEDAEHVLRQLVPLEQEVQTETEDWYLLRFRPFRTLQRSIEGVVITFINITALKQSESLIRKAKETLEQRVQERTRELDEANRKLRSLAYDLTMAEQQERQRISQVLHDDLQQRIFAVKVQTSILDDAYRQGNLDAAQVDFRQLENLLDEAISITRNLSIDLSPAVLQGEGLTDALGWLATQMQEQYGLQVDIHDNGVATQFEDSLRILLFHAIRESLFNVVKHAESLHAVITIQKSNDNVYITISDDGRGFDSETQVVQENAPGGLMRIRHRLSLMGCTLQVRSQPGDGTQVIIGVPASQVNT
jgi:two-component system, chemotaxis family, CheB/CheR fusion protein